MAKIQSNKEIVALSEYEHLRIRPGMYVSTVHETEEKISTIKNNLIVQESLTISIGLYKLLNEILDNSFDALKRDQIENGVINVSISSKNNQVTISDNAHGFHNAGKINSSSGLTNVETALTQLRAGSNFFNDDSEDSIIGTNGVGSSVVNILSSFFSIITINENERYEHIWENFKTTKQESKKGKYKETGSVVSFIPDTIIFKSSKFDIDYLTTQMVFRKYLLSKDAALSTTSLRFFYDEIEVNLGVAFLPEKYIEMDTALGSLIIYPSFQNATSVSFINSTITSGIHQKVVNDYLNNLFGVSNAHHFYESFFCLNLPPKLIRFSDQNKTKYAGTRGEVEPLILKHWEKKIKRDFVGSEIFDEINLAIEESTKVEDLKRIQKEKKKSKVRVSDKFFPCSGEKVSIFLAEGNSAAGSLMQKRDSKTEAVYALKGKVKNARKLSDLASNAELIDLITVLGLDIEKKEGCNFKNVIIATDADCLESNNLILTDIGEKLLSDIIIGDKIIDSNGEIQIITNVLEKKSNEWIEIVLNGEIFRCTENHKWTIMRNGKIIEVLAKDLQISDLFLIKDDDHLDI